MRNIFKKSLLFIATCLMASTLGAQQTTFGFESANELSSNFTYSCEYSNATMTIATDKKHGGSSSLKAYMGGSGGKSNFLVTKNSYNNVTQIKFWIASSDKGKTEFAIESCASENFSSGVNSILALTTFSNLPGISSPSNGTFYEVTITPATAINGYLRFTFRQPSSSGKYLWFDDLEITASTAPIISTDATLSALTYNGTPVPNFSANTLNYEVELPAGTTDIPTVAATKNNANASDPVITQATALPGNATVTVTAEDGTTTKIYTITFTVASSAPKVTSVTWDNIKGTATIDQVNKTITGKVINGSSLTSITPQFTGDNIVSVTPNTAQDFSNGAVTYTFTSSTNETTTYTVTITEAPAVSTDATLSSLTYGGTSVPNFSPSTLAYNIELTAGIKTPPTIAAETNHPKATTLITQAPTVPGSGKVEVTAEDGETKLTYTINYTVKAPSSDLTIHVPEVYEAKELAGGYNTPLVNYNQREYEVFYLGKSKPAGASGDIAVTYTLNHKGGYLVSSPSGSGTSMTAKDGWFKATISSLEGSFKEASEIEAKANARDEFADLPGDLKMKNNNTFELHIQGYDQFSIVAQDKKKDTKGTTPADNRYWEVYIDGSLQPQYFDKDNATTRRYDITTGRHVISLKAIGSEDSKLYGFSLRVAQEPRTKWLKGNDSTQVVMQTAAIKPVTYVTKYNNIPGAETRLEWIDQQEATGIRLQEIEGALADTLLLSGNANCAVGTYNYAVVAYYNNVETSRATGKFIVASDIQATSETNVEVYKDEEMDQITFNYFALSANDVQLTWPNGQPTGISGSGNNGKYIIGGTPTTIGTYPFTITVAGADTIISGQIKVNELNYGNNPILYLYKNNLAYEKDGIHNYLTGKGKNLIERKAKEEGLRPADQYAHYKWVIISEDADAHNAEVLAIIRGGANLPVLNLKGFTYTSDRLGWGEPDNGAIDTTAAKEKGCNIWIEQPSHPIFKYMTNISKNAKVKILSGYAHNGVMPIAITNAENTLCLASGRTRSIENYYAEGELQTAIHEVPTQISGSKKYICLPLAREVQLSTQGQKLIDGIEEYLLSNAESGITPPTLEIQKFSISDIDANIDQAENTITLRLTEEKFSQLDSLRSVTPKITLADQNTHVLPSSDEKLDLRYMYVIPKTFVVTDYISRRTYDFMIELYDPYESIDQVYEAGQWVNIFDIYGRKVATTNEDIYSMILPRGMYIVVTESGKTLKIMK